MNKLILALTVLFSLSMVAFTPAFAAVSPPALTDAFASGEDDEQDDEDDEEDYI